MAAKLTCTKESNELKLDRVTDSFIKTGNWFHSDNPGAWIQLSLGKMQATPETGSESITLHRTNSTHSSLRDQLT